jgi:hypothetical protein
MRKTAWDEHERARVAERVRAALVQAALEAYEDAAIRGLCCEGAWEVAVGALRGLDLREVAGGSREPDA